MIDSVEISTMASSRKCCQMIATTTNYDTVLQYCFQLRIAAVHVSMQSWQMRKRHFCCFVTCRRKGKAYCYSMSVYGCILSSDIYRYCYFRLLVVVRIIWGTFFELATVENPRFAVWISTLSIIVPEIWVLPVWTAMFLLPVVGRRRIHLGALSCYSSRSKIRDLPLEFRPCLH